MSDEKREQQKGEAETAPTEPVKTDAEPPAPDPKLMKALTADGSLRDPPKDAESND